MLKNLTLATVCLVGLAVVAPAIPAFAAEPAILTLRSGERVQGDLWDLYAQGFRIRVNGQDRDIPTDQVAIIEFQGHPDLAKARAAAGDTFILMRNGDVLNARLSDIGGVAPLRLTVETSSGPRDLSSADVAIIHLATVSGSAPAVAGPGPTGAPRSFTLAGNRQWTPTNIRVEQGQVISFGSSGAVRLSGNQSDFAQAGGLSQPVSGAAPLPSAPRGALLGRIDNGEPFLIGDQRTVAMPRTGTLQLGINDDVMTDNGGELRVTIIGGVAVGPQRGRGQIAR